MFYVLDNTLLPRGVTRFAWWQQGLHAIELLRAHIGEWTMTRMLDYWWVMCFTGYQLNWNSWIWIPFPIDSDCTLLCTQVDKTMDRMAPCHAWLSQQVLEHGGHCKSLPEGRQWQRKSTGGKDHAITMGILTWNVGAHERRATQHATAGF
jgi:hypothetical protein